MRMPEDELSDIQCGFSLVEVLVEIALMALIGTLLGTALLGGRQLLATAEKSLTEPTLDGVRHLLADVIAGARPIAQTGKDRPDERQPSLMGTRDRIAFTTMLEKRGQYAGLYKASIFLGDADSGAQSDLLLGLRLHSGNDQSSKLKPFDTSELNVLLRQVGGLSFEYFGRRDADQAPRWHKSWEERTRLPQAIALRLERTARGPTVALDVIIGLPFGAVD